MGFLSPKPITIDSARRTGDLQLVVLVEIRDLLAEALKQGVAPRPQA